MHFEATCVFSESWMHLCVNNWVCRWLQTVLIFCKSYFEYKVEVEKCVTEENFELDLIVRWSFLNNSLCPTFKHIYMCTGDYRFFNYVSVLSKNALQWIIHSKGSTVVYALRIHLLFKEKGDDAINKTEAMSWRDVFHPIKLSHLFK